MLFFKGKKKKAAVAQAQSTLRFALSPHIGSTMRPLKETTTVFVNLLALIFANMGLIPRHHAILTSAGGQGLTLWKVIGIAWENLVFDRRHVPQILLFFAVIASIGFSVIAVFVALSSIFVGTAHAQTTSSGCGGGYFQPCDSTQDIAMGWINYLFKNQIMYNYVDPTTGMPMLQSTVVQQALIAALGFYSDAILIVAAIILFYHLASMVVETAHHGVVMGKRANQIWAPIRLVVAIGLLVPISGGLNSGQYIVIQVAQWGSNLASQTWSVFVNNMSADSSNGVAPIAPYARKTVYDTVLMEACAEAYNANLRGAGGSCPPDDGVNQALPYNCNPKITTQAPLMADPPTEQTLANGDIQYNYVIPPDSGMATPIADKGACGNVVFPKPNSGTSDATFQAAKAAFVAMQGQAQQFAQTHMTSFLPPNIGGTNDQAPPANSGDFETLVSNYQQALQAAVPIPNFSDLTNDTSAQGWVSAGAWFNSIAREQSTAMDAARQLPQTQAPNIKGNASGLQKSMLPALRDFQQWLNAEDPSTAAINAGGGMPNQQQQLMTAMTGFTQQQNSSSGHYMDKVFMVIDVVASWNNVWQSYNSTCGANASNTAVTGTVPTQNGAPCFTLGVVFNGVNPLAQVAALGHANINTAYDLFDIYLKFIGYTDAAVTGTTAGVALATATTSVIPALAGAGGAIGNLFSTLVGAPVEAVRGAIGTVLGLICAIFFGTGAVLAFFLPLLPFFRFLFGVLTWIVALLEAVIAMPLVALAHLNPEGDGLPGASAKSAYHFVFNIFLRPVLMIFGLIVGLLIFYIAVSYMNMLYMQAVVGSGGIAYGHLLMSRFLYSIMYVFALYMCATTAFHMIDILPEHAMKWMGGQGLTFHKMGNPEDMAQPIGLATGYAESSVFQAVGGLKGGAGAAALALASGVKDKQGLKDMIARDTNQAANLLGKNGHPEVAADIRKGGQAMQDGVDKLADMYGRVSGSDPSSAPDMTNVTPPPRPGLSPPPPPGQPPDLTNIKPPPRPQGGS